MLKSTMLTAEPTERDAAPGAIRGGDCDLIAQTLHTQPVRELDDRSSNGVWKPSSYVIWVYPPDAPPPNSRLPSARRAGHCH